MFCTVLYLYGTGAPAREVEPAANGRLVLVRQVLDRRHAERRARARRQRLGDRDARRAGGRTRVRNVRRQRVPPLVLQIRHREGASYSVYYCTVLYLLIYVTLLHIFILYLYFVHEYSIADLSPVWVTHSHSDLTVNANMFIERHRNGIGGCEVDRRSI